MTHGHDQDTDRLIGEVSRQLKLPVALDSAISDRVMAEIRRPIGSPGRSLAWVSVALAAGLAAIAFFLSRNGATGISDQGVSFSLEAPGASRVCLVGDFNNWDPAATPLERVSTGGRWEAIVPLTPGRYQFTFVIDGSHWVADPELPKAMGDDFGQPTSVITVVHRGRS